MAKKVPTAKIITSVLALGLAFWLGRVSSPGGDPEPGDSQDASPRSTERSARKNPKRDKIANGEGAGDQSIGTALQLREIFANTRGQYGLGSSLAKQRLAKMNTGELSQLVHDLAEQQSSTTGYSYHLEIQAACTRWAEIDPDTALSFVLANKQHSFLTAALSSVFAGIVNYDPQLALAKLHEIDDPGVRHTARISVLSSLALSEPDIWMEAIKERPELWRNLNIYTAAAEWAMDDPKAAADRIMQLPDHLQAQGISSISSVWASKNPQAALAWAKSLETPNLRTLAMSGVVTALAKEDFQQAITVIDSLNPQARKTSLTNIFRTLANVDFDRAIEQAMGMTSKLDQKTALRELLGLSHYSGSSWGYRNYNGHGHSNASADQLRKLINKLPKSSLRRQALGQLGTKMAVYSEQEASEYIKNYPAAEQELIKSAMIKSLSYSNPERAIKIYQSIPPDQRSSGIYNQILSNLANTNPEEALSLALKMKTPEQQAQNANYAFIKLAKDDPSGTASRFDDLPEGPVRNAALRTIASAWGQSDPTAAIQWAKGLTGKEQPDALSNILSHYGRIDPQAAALVLEQALAEHSNDSSWNLSSPASSIAFAMGQENPATAAEWISKLPEGSTQTSAIRALAKTWSHEDIDGAADWINGLPDGKARDTGISTVVNTISNKNPAAAFDWANSMGDDRKRLSNLQSIIYSWKRKDPDEARTAVEQADLTEKERERLMKSFK